MKHKIIDLKDAPEIAATMDRFMQEGTDPEGMWAEVTNQLKAKGLVPQDFEHSEENTLTTYDGAGNDSTIYCESDDDAFADFMQLLGNDAPADLAEVGGAY